MTRLNKYDHVLAERRNVGQINNVHDKFDVMRLYATQANETGALANAGHSTSATHSYERLAAIRDAATETWIAERKDADKSILA